MYGTSKRNKSPLKSITEDMISTNHLERQQQKPNINPLTAINAITKSTLKFGFDAFWLQCLLQKVIVTAV